MSMIGLQSIADSMKHSRELLMSGRMQLREYLARMEAAEADVRTLLADVIEADEALNAAELAPTGDDYNGLYSLVI